MKQVKSLGVGKVSVVTADLAAGNYVVICNVAGHYQLGMRAALKVRIASARHFRISRKLTRSVICCSESPSFGIAVPGFTAGGFAIQLLQVLFVHR